MENDQTFDAEYLVLSFASEMNAWESAFHKEWSAHFDSYREGASAEAMAAYRAKDEEVQERHRLIYREIFSRYCTERERKYGGPAKPLSAGVPTKYDGIDKSSSAASSVKKSASRIEVIFEALKTILPRKIQFVVLRSKAGWRIDGYKYQYTGEEKWRNGIL